MLVPTRNSVTMQKINYNILSFTW